MVSGVLSLRPRLDVVVDGVPVSGAFFSRLSSLEIIDREGIASDTIEVCFDDSVPHFLSPRRGARISVSILLGVSSFNIGSYVVDHVQYECLPYKITVRGHSSDLTSEMRASRSKHWDNASVKDIVQEKADFHELEAKISDEVSSFVYEWVGQQEETDLNFLNRLAARHGALFSIKDGTLLWLDRGLGTSAAGVSIAAATVPSTDIIKGTCQVTETDVDRYRTVRAYWQDKVNAKREPVDVDADPDAAGVHTLRDTFGSKGEAEGAARAAAKEILRGLTRTACSVIGRPDLMAGLPVQYDGVRPGVDGRPFILETVTHRFDKASGLVTSFTGKSKAGE